MIAELLFRILEMDNEEEPGRAYYPRPSLSGPERCERQLVYSAMGTEVDKDLTGRTLSIFADGSLHELALGDMIHKTSFHLHSDQMKIQVSMLGLTLNGSIDGIVTDILGVDRLIEFKGLNHFTWERYWGKDVLPEDYLAQVAIYCRGLQEVNPHIREIVLLIKNKNTSGLIDYLLDYDRDTDTLTILKKTNHLGEVQVIHTKEKPVVREQIVEKSFRKFIEVQAHADAGTLPDRPYEMDDFHCQYCSFSRQCWASYSEEVEALADSAELDPELADEVRYYRELGSEIAEQKKVRDAMRVKLLGVMQEKQAKVGKIGEYLVKMSISPTSKLGDLPEAVDRMLDKYRVDGWMTKLTVVPLPKPKEVKPKKAKKKKEGSDE